jgi:hypothetical protein
VSVEGSELVEVEAEDVVSELRCVVKFVHWRYPTYCSTFSGEEKKLNMLVEVTSNFVHGYIFIVDLSWELSWEEAHSSI